MRNLNDINKEIKVARKTLIATSDNTAYTAAQSKLSDLLAEKRAYMNKDAGDFEMTENCWHKTHTE